MKIKTGFVVKEIAGQCVVVALGSASKVFNGIIKLNDSAKFIWQCIEEGLEKDAIVDRMLDVYEGIDREIADRDCEAFINKLRSAGILE